MRSQTPRIRAEALLADARSRNIISAGQEAEALDALANARDLGLRRIDPSFFQSFGSQFRGDLQTAILNQDWGSLGDSIFSAISTSLLDRAFDLVADTGIGRFLGFDLQAGGAALSRRGAG